MKFCSFFQIVFSFFFYTVKADWGGPCPSPFLKEVICVIEVKNLVKRYGDHYAVNHLSFTVEDGQIFGFLGPNGAGKSTTMNIMTGYLAATEGQVLVEGHDILEEPEAARACIGYLPEIPPLYPDMTVEEYLRFCAELKKIPKEQRTDQLTKVLALTHLEDMSARLIRNLSKGYRASPAGPCWGGRRTQPDLPSTWRGTSGRRCSSPLQRRGCPCWSCGPGRPLWRRSSWI